VAHTRTCKWGGTLVILVMLYLSHWPVSTSTLHQTFICNDYHQLYDFCVCYWSSCNLLWYLPLVGELMSGKSSVMQTNAKAAWMQLAMSFCSCLSSWHRAFRQEAWLPLNCIVIPFHKLLSSLAVVAQEWCPIIDLCWQRILAETWMNYTVSNQFVKFPPARFCLLHIGQVSLSLRLYFSYQSEVLPAKFCGENCSDCGLTKKSLV